MQFNKSFDSVLRSGNCPAGQANIPVFSEPSAVFTGITCINEIPSGTLYYQRVGSAVTITSIQLTFILSAVPNTGSYCARIMLVYDKQTNGVAPLFRDIMSDNDALPSYFTASYNYTNSDRFIVLMDEYYNVNPGIGTQLVFRVPLEGLSLPSYYGSNVGTIADIRSGGIYLVATSSSGAATVPILPRAIVTYSD